MKIHLHDPSYKEEDFTRSPHVIRAIRNGWMTKCKIGVASDERVTKKLSEVTCIGCLEAEERSPTRRGRFTSFLEVVTVVALATTGIGFILFAILWIERDLDYAYNQFLHLVRKAID